MQRHLCRDGQADPPTAHRRPAPRLMRPDGPVSSETLHRYREIVAQYPRETLTSEAASDPAGTQDADGTGERHAKAFNDTANHSSQRAARRMRHNGLRLQ